MRQLGPSPSRPDPPPASEKLTSGGKRNLSKGPEIGADSRCTVVSSGVGQARYAVTPWPSNQTRSQTLVWPLTSPPRPPLCVTVSAALSNSLLRSITRSEVGAASPAIRGKTTSLCSTAIP